MNVSHQPVIGLNGSPT